MDTLRELVGAGNVEVYSVDEAFLDLSAVPNEQLYKVAKEIKETVEEWTGIKVSIGVAPTKVLAKVANRLSKKDKQRSDCIMVLDMEEKILKALKQTAVEDIWGVGYRSSAKLKQLWGIYDGLQLRNMSEEWARKTLGGVVGVRLIKELKGEQTIEMKDPLEQKKMIATTRTDAVQATGDLVAATVAELAAGVQDGEHDLGGGPALLLQHPDRDAAAVVDDRDRVVGMDRHFDGVAVTRQRLVDGVVDDLVNEVMKAADTGRADVHAGTLANRLEPLEDGDVVGAVTALGAVFTFRVRVVLHTFPSRSGAMSIMPRPAAAKVPQ